MPLLELLRGVGPGVAALALCELTLERGVALERVHDVLQLACHQLFAHARSLKVGDQVVD